ncbi:hypothetical protein Taro_015283 [Colocasia esculenta]|uniref:Uncharacterized protein n=1 Tax=Colocasia esculenta TaxID=4460 RepID=A0A843UHC6_COLES|nr:hypothetical protein [Colocasia esculenta]
MTLLDNITKAVAGDATAAPTTGSKFSVVLNAPEDFHGLTPEGGDLPGASPVTRLAGWRIQEADAEAIYSVQKLVKKLRRKLKNPNTMDREEFLGLLGSFPAERLGSVTDGELVGLLAEGCVVLGLWELLKGLILQGHVGWFGASDLVEKLVERGQSDLLCLYVRHASDLRASELLLIVGHFLSPTRNSREGMLKVRKEWESQCLLAMEKAIQKGVHEKVATLARDASILLMMAHDGFSSSELCLHYLFSSSNIDGLVMSSAISKLGGLELLGLIRYLKKWLEKYERFPEACPVPEAGKVLGLKACELVPSLESVARGLGLVIDEHYSYLVLNSQLHEEVKSAWRIVSSLVSVTDPCCSIADVIEKLCAIIAIEQWLEQSICFKARRLAGFEFKIQNDKKYIYLKLITGIWPPTIVRFRHRPSDSAIGSQSPAIAGFRHRLLESIVGGRIPETDWRLPDSGTGRRNPPLTARFRRPTGDSRWNPTSDNLRIPAPAAGICHCGRSPAIVGF